MKKAILCFDLPASAAKRNAGEMHDKPKSSFRAAAERWGCDLVLVTEPVHQAHVFWQKAMGWRVVETYDRVLQLDADMTIRGDAPSPFDVVPEGHWGVVSSVQLHDVWSNWREKADIHWANFMGETRIPREKHLNAGFLLYEPTTHREILEEWVEVGRRSGWNHNLCPEQAVLSLLLHHRNPLQSWLPHDWNWIQPPGVPLRQGHQIPWIQHFVAHWKKPRLDKVWWNVTPGYTPQSRTIARRAKGFFVELGVLNGWNADSVLGQQPEIEKALLVDLWAKQSEDSTYARSGDLVHRRNDQSRFDDKQSETRERMRKYGKKVSIVQDDTARAAELVEDGTVDCVFVDADHSYEGVKRDMEAWWDKVKSGGWMGGHDFDMSKSGRCGRHEIDWGVHIAVPEFCEKHGLEYTQDVGDTWWIRKP